jgi:hypothetical protein
MELAAFIISMISLAVAGVACWSSLQQADSTARAAEEAERATEVAAEALSDARAAHDLETERARVELSPEFTLTPLREAAQVQQGYRLVSAGPIPYERVSLEVLPPRPDLVEGFLADGDVTLRLEITDVPVGGQALVTLVRTNRERAGDVQIRVTAYRGAESWQVVLPVRLKRPPMLASF